MNTTRFRIRKQNNGTHLPTITKRQEEYFSSSNEAFEMIHKKTNVITTSYLVPHLSQRKLIKFPNNKNQMDADFKKYEILLLNPQDPGWGSSKEIQNYYLESAKEKGWDCKVWLNGQEFCRKKLNS